MYQPILFYLYQWWLIMTQSWWHEVDFGKALPTTQQMFYLLPMIKKKKGWHAWKSANWDNQLSIIKRSAPFFRWLFFLECLKMWVDPSWYFLPCNLGGTKQDPKKFSWRLVILLTSVVWGPYVETLKKPFPNKQKKGANWSLCLICTYLVFRDIMKTHAL